MLKRLAAVVLIGAFFQTGVLAQEEEVVFREGYKEAKWGYSQAEVIRAFPGYQFYEGYDTFYIKDTFHEGTPVDVAFYFEDNRLYMIQFMVETPRRVGTFSSLQKIPASFTRLENYFTDRFSKPAYRDWVVDAEPGESEAAAIARGNGHYTTVWKRSQTTIELELQGDGEGLGAVVYFQYTCIGCLDQ